MKPPSLARRAAAVLTTLATACGPVADGVSGAEEVQTTSQDIVLGPTIPTFPTPKPYEGIVGRGYTRRAPVTRLEFKSAPIFYGGGWREYLATDRGPCVEFSSGVPAPTTSAFTTEVLATMVEGRRSFSFASSGGVKATTSLDVVIPVEGIPVPVGAGDDVDLAVDMVQTASFNTANATMYAVARGPRVRGSGAPRLRQAVVDELMALPVSSRARAFFARCGETYLDDVTLGGFIAIDISLSSSTATGAVNARAELERRLNLGFQSNETPQASNGDVLLSLLESLGVSLDASANSTMNVTVNNEQMQLTLRVRSMGPTLPANLTVFDAYALVSDWGGFLQSRPNDLAVMGATPKLYATVDNTSALGISLPAFILDSGYNALMAELNSYFLTHYTKLLHFSFMQRVRDTNGDNMTANGKIWVFSSTDPLPSLAEVQKARVDALVNMFAVSQAQQCLLNVPPASPTTEYSRCMNQTKLNTGAGALGRFVLPIQDLATALSERDTLTARQAALGQSTTVNVITLGPGDYPRVHDRRGEVVIGNTFADFFEPLDDAGISVGVTTQERSEQGCVIESFKGDAHFVSGRSDDGNWLTDSMCTFSLWPSFSLFLRDGWRLRTALWDEEGAFNVGFPLTTATHPLNSISGQVKVDHELEPWVGVRLDSVRLTGPLSLPGSNEMAFTVPGRLIDFAMEL
jgi:hypothetical protein